MQVQLRKERKWQKLKSRLTYKNPWIKVYEDEVINPDGNKGIYGYLDKVKGVFVVPVDKDGSIYLIEEYRYVIKKSVLELPAGAVKDDNSWENAQRELKEETGMTSKEWKYLGGCYVAPGHETTYIDVFMANNVDTSTIKISDQESDESILKIIKVSVEELKELIRDNKIECGVTLAALNMFFIAVGK
jgi:8-oxo-dGTP pyrophosphatase MutT (NUDIX family)